MKKLSTIAITTVLLGLSSAALAKSYICTTKDSNTKFIKDTTVFICTGGLPDMAMQEINRKGYRVVSITVNNYVNGGYNYTDWAIVIEK